MVLLVGENPLARGRHPGRRRLRHGQGIGFTLFYATNFIFTGLAVAVAFHAACSTSAARARPISRGLGVALVVPCARQHAALVADLPAGHRSPRRWSARSGRCIPAYLQAKRGSHIVITTIMFNFIAAALMVYLLVDVLKPAGSMAPQTRTFLDGGAAAEAQLAARGCSASTIARAPLNVSFLLALVMAVLVWLLIWRTKLGYEMRTMGHSPKAARLCRHLGKPASSSSP